MSTLSSVPKTVWIAGAGTLAIISADSLPNPRARLITRTVGGIAIAAAFFMGLDDLAELFGLKKRDVPRVEEEVTAPIAGPITTGPVGLIAATFLSPLEGENLITTSGTYKVRVRLSNSTTASKLLRVHVVSKEFYSFGGSNDRTSPVGAWNLAPGQQKTAAINVDTASDGPTNPFHPVQVSLELYVNDELRDTIRFTYE